MIYNRVQHTGVFMLLQVVLCQAAQTVAAQAAADAASKASPLAANAPQADLAADCAKVGDPLLQSYSHDTKRVTQEPFICVHGSEFTTAHKQVSVHHRHALI